MLNFEATSENNIAAANKKNVFLLQDKMSE